VAPYNAQVSDLRARLPKMRIGTVDKFQGQEARWRSFADHVVAGRGAARDGVLYSLNRFERGDIAGDDDK